MSKIIIVGSNHANTAEYYKTLGLPASVLVTNVDHDQLIGHTCIQDIPDCAILEIVLKNADEVYWAESSKDEFFNDDSYYDFLNWLRDYNLKHHNVKNFKAIRLDPYVWTTQLPELTAQDMVFFGSSTTQGHGIDNPVDQYANIVATHFKKNAINIPKIVNSLGNNDKSFDLFFQLDFIPGQMVVLHVAPLMRMRYCADNHQLVEVQLATAILPNHKQLVQVFTEEFSFYNLLVKIRAMVKFAREKKLKFVFFLDDYKQGSISDRDQQYFYEFPEYLSPTNLKNEMFQDYGTDNKHPGIKSNKAISDHIIKHMENLYK